MTQNSINNTASILDVDNIRLDGNTISSTDTNGNIVLAPDGSGVISVTAAPVVPSGDRADSLGSATNSWDNVYADGLTFDDGSNILSIYEKGTFTPSLSFETETTPPVYDTQTGTYYRIGNLVIINIILVLTSKGTGSGNALISGLPYACGTARSYLYWTGVNLGFRNMNNKSFGGRFNQSDTTMTISSQRGGDSFSLKIDDFEDDSEARCTAFYGV
jgi:hypothetical protein